MDMRTGDLVRIAPRFTDVPAVGLYAGPSTSVPDRFSDIACDDLSLVVGTTTRMDGEMMVLVLVARTFKVGWCRNTYLLEAVE